MFWFIEWIALGRDLLTGMSNILECLISLFLVSSTAA